MTHAATIARGSTGFFVLIGAIVLFSAQCGRNSKELDSPVPKINLWAWERPENLMWIEGRTDVGVAYLAQTVNITSERVDIKPRMQPLRVPPGTFLTAVTRVETQRSAGKRPDLSIKQQEAVRAVVLENVGRKGVGAIQIDFDAVESERPSYTELIRSIKASLPDSVHFSITALASWCTGDRWIGDLPVDEAVPMIFDMGTDDKVIRKFLDNGNDWNEPLCRTSYGLAVYESVPAGLKPARRYYHFNSRSWKESDLKLIAGEK